MIALGIVLDRDLPVRRQWVVMGVRADQVRCGGGKGQDLSFQSVVTFGHRWGIPIQISKHKTTQRIDLHRLQSNAVVWKILHLVTAACKSEPAIEAIAPSVIGAGNCVAQVALTLEETVRAVLADIVEPSDLTVGVA